ncbi:hypothetical protein SprV_0301208000 [Sparganum proliferum]
MPLVLNAILDDLGIFRGRFHAFRCHSSMHKNSFEAKPPLETVELSYADQETFMNWRWSCFYLHVAVFRGSQKLLVEFSCLFSDDVAVARYILLMVVCWPQRQGRLHPHYALIMHGANRLGTTAEVNIYGLPYSRLFLLGVPEVLAFTP